MKSPKIRCLEATIAVVLTSCTVTVPYTAELQEQYKLGTADLSNLQFYLSDAVILYRVSPEGLAETGSGDLVVHHDEHTEEIILRPGTPGVVVGFREDKLLVKFEVGEGRFLIFGNQTGSGPFYLMAEEWTKGHGKVMYNGTTYFAKPGAGKAHLEIQMKKVREMAKTTRIPKGVKLAPQ